MGQEAPSAHGQGCRACAAGTYRGCPGAPAAALYHQRIAEGQEAQRAADEERASDAAARRAKRAVVTAWAGKGVTMTLAGAIVVYACMAALCGVAFWWQMRQWKKHKAASLDERIECRGGCSDPWQPRRLFYELHGEKGIGLACVCPVCYFRITGEAAEGNPKTKRAFT